VVLARFDELSQQSICHLIAAINPNQIHGDQIISYVTVELALIAANINQSNCLRGDRVVIQTRSGRRE